MKPSRFTEEQIIGILREHEAGAATADILLQAGDLERDVLPAARTWFSWSCCATVWYSG
ncbi:hypothetical protein V1286_003851 [Bradyrhizobium algeriense]|uniref:Transposase n=1 Tax=Bradyrhizobium algeriense TaxID=634784 RepID=A0ABU8BCR7_9BRAD